MDILKRLFGGSSGANRSSGNDPNAIIYYIKVRKCGAIARLRVDLRNDLSQDDEGDNYVVRKQVVDNVCYGMAEIVLHFDANRREISRTVEHGEFVDVTAYEEQESQRISPRESRGT